MKKTNYTLAQAIVIIENQAISHYNNAALSKDIQYKDMCRALELELKTVVSILKRVNNI